MIRFGSYRQILKRISLREERIKVFGPIYTFMDGHIEYIDRDIYMDIARSRDLKLAVNLSKFEIEKRAKSKNCLRKKNYFMSLGAMNTFVLMHQVEDFSFGLINREQVRKEDRTIIWE